MTTRPPDPAPRANRRKTLAEFEAQRETLRCQRCGRSGLAHKPQKNAAGLQVFCPHCGHDLPLGYLLYLKQRGPRMRKPLTGSGESVDEVWEILDGRCLSCGLTKAEVELIGFDRERHHAPPLADAGSEENTIILPACTGCHSAMTHQRAAARRQLAKIRQRDVQGKVKDLVAGMSLPASVTRDIEVRAAVEQSVDEHNRRRAEQLTLADTPPEEPQQG